MARRNEAASDLWYKYQNEMGLPAYVPRYLAVRLLGISKDKVNAHIAMGHLKVDALTNKVSLYSIAEMQCR